jgi:hypothetical protein
MDQLEKKNIHINIIEQGKDDLETSNNKSETYIILMNEELNNKNREQIEEIKDLNSQIVELENQSDRSEKSITYMRGLLKNFVELKNMLINLNKLYLDKYNNSNQKMDFINKFIIELNQFVKIIPFVSGLILSFTFLMGMISIYEILMYMFLLGITVLILMAYTKISIELFYNFDKFKSNVDELTKHYNVKIVSLENIIKKVEDGNDFLNEYIDVI